MKTFEEIYPLLESSDRRDAKILFDFFRNHTILKKMLLDLEVFSETVPYVKHRPRAGYMNYVFNINDYSLYPIYMFDLMIDWSGNIEIKNYDAYTGEELFYEEIRLSYLVMMWSDVLRRKAMAFLGYTYGYEYEGQKSIYLLYIKNNILDIPVDFLYPDFTEDEVIIFDMFPELKLCSTRLYKLLEANEKFGGRFIIELNNLKLNIKNEEVRQVQRIQDILVQNKKDIIVYVDKEKDKLIEMAGDNNRNIDILKMQALTILNQ